MSIDVKLYKQTAENYQDYSKADRRKKILKATSRYPDIGSCHYASNFVSVEIRYRS